MGNLQNLTFDQVTKGDSGGKKSGGKKNDGKKTASDSNAKWQKSQLQNLTFEEASKMSKQEKKDEQARLKELNWGNRQHTTSGKMGEVQGARYNSDTGLVVGAAFEDQNKPVTQPTTQQPVQQNTTGQQNEPTATAAGSQVQDPRKIMSNDIANPANRMSADQLKQYQRLQLRQQELEQMLQNSNVDTDFTLATAEEYAAANKEYQSNKKLLSDMEQEVSAKKQASAARQEYDSVMDDGMYETMASEMYGKSYAELSQSERNKVARKVDSRRAQYNTGGAGMPASVMTKQELSREMSALQTKMETGEATDEDYSRWLDLDRHYYAQGGYAYARAGLDAVVSYEADMINNLGTTMAAIGGDAERGTYTEETAEGLASSATELQSLGDDLDKRLTAANDAEAKLEIHYNELLEMEADLDTASEKEVAAYNKKVEQFNQELKDVNAMFDDMQGDIFRYNELLAQHNTTYDQFMADAETYEENRYKGFGGLGRRIMDAGDTLANYSSQDLANLKAERGIFGDAALDIEMNLIQMAIDKAAGDMIGGKITGAGKVAGFFKDHMSLLPMFVRSTGGGMREARYEGATIGEQMLYGNLSGAIEVATELMNDGLNGIYGAGMSRWMKVGGESLDKVSERTIYKLAKKPLGRIFLRSLKDMHEEGMEEVVSSILGEFASMIYNDKSLQETLAGMKDEEFLSNLLYDYIIGGMVAGVSGVGALTVSTAQNMKTLKGISRSMSQAYAQNLANANGIELTQQDLESIKGKVSLKEANALTDIQQHLQKTGVLDRFTQTMSEEDADTFLANAHLHVFYLMMQQECTVQEAVREYIKNVDADLKKMGEADPAKQTQAEGVKLGEAFEGEPAAETAGPATAQGTAQAEAETQTVQEEAPAAEPVQETETEPAEEPVQKPVAERSWKELPDEVKVMDIPNSGDVNHATVDGVTFEVYAEGRRVTARVSDAEGNVAEAPVQWQAAAGLSDAFEKYKKIIKENAEKAGGNNNGGTEEADLVQRGGRGRESGERAKRSNGSVGEDERAKAQRQIRQRESAERRLSEVNKAGGNYVSGQDLGDRNASYTKDIRIIPTSSYDQELSDLDAEIFYITGYHATFVTKGIELQNGEVVNGWYDENTGKIVINACHRTIPAKWLARHEEFHAAKATNPGLVKEIINRVKADPELSTLFEEMKAEYSKGIYGGLTQNLDQEEAEEYIAEEIFGDAHAEYYRYGTNAPAFREIVESVLDERKITTVPKNVSPDEADASQIAAAEAAPRGPPAELSIEERIANGEYIDPVELGQAYEEPAAEKPKKKRGQRNWTQQTFDNIMESMRTMTDFVGGISASSSYSEAAAQRDLASLLTWYSNKLAAGKKPSMSEAYSRAFKIAEGMVDNGHIGTGNVNQEVVDLVKSMVGGKTIRMGDNLNDAGTSLGDRSSQYPYLRLGRDKGENLDIIWQRLSDPDYGGMPGVFDPYAAPDEMLETLNSMLTPERQQNPNYQTEDERAQFIDEVAQRLLLNIQNELEGADNVKDVGDIPSNLKEAAGIETDAESESAAPGEMRYSEATWNESDYVKDQKVAAEALAKALGCTKKKATQYIKDVNSVAKMIAEDRARLDYKAAPGRSSFVSNSEYGGSFDFSTLCKKRRLMTGTLTAIQKAIGSDALTPTEILAVRQMMKDQGLEVSCGLCYVEGSRTAMGQNSLKFLELYRKHYPGEWIPSIVQCTTPDGVEEMRTQHPEAYERYERFWNNHGQLEKGDPNLFASQQKPKLYQVRTSYKGEIMQNFSRGASVEAKNEAGGIRCQSFSDFEIVHLIDMMQIVMDMARVGLAGQAYTKVPEFAKALGTTGMKINLSLIAKSVDLQGNLIFDDVEGMPAETAFAIRNAEGVKEPQLADIQRKNVGTILVVFNDAQLKAAMADERIDFIIPFHRSQWKKAQYKAMGLPDIVKDYTYQQNEKWLHPENHTHKFTDKSGTRDVKDKATNYFPNAYWDFSKTGKENAEEYLRMCAAEDKRPKFYKLLVKNADGSFSLQPDGSTDGYWKLLGDFKMYDNDGVGSPQTPVTPTFNMEEAKAMMDAYQGGHENFPVAKGIVDQFVKERKAGKKYSADDEVIRSDLEMSTEEQEVAADTHIRYSVHEGEEPVNYQWGFKLMNVDKEGLPHAMFIDAAAPYEFGVLYDADSPNLEDLINLEPGYAYLTDMDGNVDMEARKPITRKNGAFAGLPGKAAIDQATAEGKRWMAVGRYADGQPNIANIGINGSGGVSTFALRPGIHAVDIPSMAHIGSKSEGSKKIDTRRENQRWFLIEYPVDNDYNEEAYKHKSKDIRDHLPTNGWYSFQTNSGAEKRQHWFITGGMRIVGSVSEADVRWYADQHGFEQDLPWKNGKSYQDVDDTTIDLKQYAAEHQDTKTPSKTEMKERLSGKKYSADDGTGTEYADYWQMGEPDTEAGMDILYPKYVNATDRRVNNQDEFFSDKGNAKYHRDVDRAKLETYAKTQAWKDGLINPITGVRPHYTSTKAGQWNQYSYVVYDARTKQVLVDPKTMEVKQYGVDDFIDNYLEKLGAEDTIKFKYSVDSEGTELTESQEKFFSESQVRDSEGNLMVVYHGTNQGDFNEFLWDKTQRSDGGFYGRGHYFTSRKGMADIYGSRLVKAYLNITNPFVWSEQVNEYKGNEITNIQSRNIAARINMARVFPKLFADKVMEYGQYNNQTGEMDQKSIKWSELEGEIEKTIGTLKPLLFSDDTVQWAYPGELWDHNVGERYANMEDAEKHKFEAAVQAFIETHQGVAYDMTYDDQTSWTQDHGSEITEALKEMGYDGAMQDRAGTEIVAFESNQIKNVDNKNPSKSNDIRYSAGTEEFNEHYMELAETSPDDPELDAMVEQAARAAGYNSPLLYHGTDAFGFTKIDFSKSDDQISFFATPSEKTASSYTRSGQKRKISGDDTKANLEKIREANGQDLADMLAEYNEDVTESEFVNEDNFYEKERDLISMMKGSYLNISEKIEREYGFDREAGPGELMMSQRMYDMLSLADEISAALEVIVETKARTEAAMDLIDNVIIPNYEAIIHDESTMPVPDFETEEEERAYKRRNNWDVEHLQTLLEYTIDGNLMDNSVGTVEGIPLIDSMRAAFSKAGEGYFKVVEELNEGWNIETSRLSREQAAEKTERGMNRYVSKEENAYAKGIYSLYANLDNALEIEGYGSEWNRIGISDGDIIRFAKDPSKLPEVDEEELEMVDYYTTRDIAEFAKDQGYDCVIIHDIYDYGNKNYQSNKTPEDIFIFLDETKVKSADPVTYDDEGKIIPIQERFKPVNELRYSVDSEEFNDQYMELTKDPVENYDELYKMVKAAAQNAGYDSPMLYHGTNAFGFTEIDFSKSDDRISFFATSSPDVAGSYASKDFLTDIGKKKESSDRPGIYSMYANTEGFLDIDANGYSWALIKIEGEQFDKIFEFESAAYHNMVLSNQGELSIDEEKKIAYLSTRAIAYAAWENECPGLIIRNVVDYGKYGKRYDSWDPKDVYVFFDATRVKSADNITYDDNGNVIPIQERFQPINELRYSFEDEGETITEGAYIDDSKFPYSEVIKSGNKLGETRLKPKAIFERAYKNGTRIALDRSKVKGENAAYATTKIGKPVWIPAEEWEQNRYEGLQHWVPKGSDYDLKEGQEGKWYYPFEGLHVLDEEVKPVTNSAYGAKYSAEDDDRADYLDSLGTVEPKGGRVDEDYMEGLTGSQQEMDQSAATMSEEEFNDYVNSLMEKARRGKNTPGLPPDGMTMEQWVDEINKRAEIAMAQRIRTLTKEEFTPSAALKKLGIRVAGSLGHYWNLDQLIANDRAAKSVQKQTRRAERKLNPTDTEKYYASGLAAGVIYSDQLPPNIRQNVVEELADYYYAEKSTGSDLLTKQRAAISAALQEKMMALLGEMPRVKKVDTTSLMFNTPERSMRRIFGDKNGKLVYEQIFRPVKTNEAERTRFVNKMYDEVRTFTDSKGKTRKLSNSEWAAAQIVLEGTASATELVDFLKNQTKLREAARLLNKDINADLSKLKLSAEEMQQAMDYKDRVEERNLREKDGGLTKEELSRLYEKRNNMSKEEKAKSDMIAALLDADRTVKFKDVDGTIVDAAAAKLKGLFNDMYDAYNDFFVAHGYEPVAYRKNYAPHMQGNDIDGSVRSILTMMGLPAQAQELPTAIAGMTASYKPNKKWNPHLLQRTGHETNYDLGSAYETYVGYMADIIYHMDDIMRIRAMNSYLRANADEDKSDLLNQALLIRRESVEAKQEFLKVNGIVGSRTVMSDKDVDEKLQEYVTQTIADMDKKSEDSSLVMWLDNYANVLAGKQQYGDRGFESNFGRNKLNIANWLSGKFGMSQVAGKLSSVLNQAAQLPIIAAELPTRDFVSAARDIVTGRVKKTGFTNESDFLVNKAGTDYVVKSVKDMVIEATFAPAGFMDSLMSTLAVRGKYNQMMRQLQTQTEAELKESGLNAEQVTGEMQKRAEEIQRKAMQAADDFGGEIMGSREKGTKPLIFDSKDPFVRMITIFQVEALNTWEHVAKDLPRDFNQIKEEKGVAAAAGALALVIVKSLLASFALNRLDDELYGGSPAPFDLLGMTANFIASGQGLTTNKYLETLIDNGLEELGAGRIFGTGDRENAKLEDGEFDLKAAMQDTRYNIVNDIPLVRNVASVLGMGDNSMPLAGLSEIKDLFGEDGEIEALYDGATAKERAAIANTMLNMFLQFVPGGSQASKTYKGLKLFAEGGSYDSKGRLRYAVDDDILTAARLAMFGTYGIPETAEYWADGGNPLNKAQTEAFESMVESGMRRTEAEKAVRSFEPEGEKTRQKSANMAASLKESDLDTEMQIGLWSAYSTNQEKLAFDFLTSAAGGSHNRENIYQTVSRANQLLQEMVGDESYKQSDIKAVCDRLQASNEVKAAIWASYGKSWAEKNNPYGTSYAKSAKDYYNG